MPATITDVAEMLHSRNITFSPGDIATSRWSLMLLLIIYSKCEKH